MAAQNGHTAVVEILVKAGADVNTVSDVGCGEVLKSRRRRVDPNTLYTSMQNEWSLGVQMP